MSARNSFYLGTAVAATAVAGAVWYGYRHYPEGGIREILGALRESATNALESLRKVGSLAGGIFSRNKNYIKLEKSLSLNSKDISEANPSQEDLIRLAEKLQNNASAMEKTIIGLRQDLDALSKESKTRAEPVENIDESKKALVGLYQYVLYLARINNLGFITMDEWEQQQQQQQQEQ